MWRLFMYVTLFHICVHALSMYVCCNYVWRLYVCIYVFVCMRTNIIYSTFYDDWFTNWRMCIPIFYNSSFHTLHWWLTMESIAMFASKCDHTSNSILIFLATFDISILRDIRFWAQKVCKCVRMYVWMNYKLIW